MKITIIYRDGSKEEFVETRSPALPLVYTKENKVFMFGSKQIRREPYYYELSPEDTKKYNDSLKVMECLK